MKKVIYVIIINLIVTFILSAQDVFVVTPPADFIGVEAKIVKTVVEQNSQQLQLANNLVKVFLYKRKK